MSHRYYHPAWKVYYHEILEAAPWLSWSQAQRMLSDYINQSGDAKDLKKFCAPCYRIYKLIDKTGKERRSSKCPSSCPVRCPRHVQVQIEFPG
jgi:hypothetical protein